MIFLHLLLFAQLQARAGSTNEHQIYSQSLHNPATVIFKDTLLIFMIAEEILGRQMCNLLSQFQESEESTRNSAFGFHKKGRLQASDHRVNLENATQVFLKA